MHTIQCNAQTWSSAMQLPTCSSAFRTHVQARCHCCCAAGGCWHPCTRIKLCVCVCVCNTCMTCVRVRVGGEIQPTYTALAAYIQLIYSLYTAHVHRKQAHTPHIHLTHPHHTLATTTDMSSIFPPLYTMSNTSVAAIEYGVACVCC